MDFNKLFQGNCIEIMASFPDESIDLTITSPPYDNLRNYTGFDFDYYKIAQQLFRITKKGGVVVWVIGDATVEGSETGSSFEQALYFKRIGFDLHDTMIYQKNAYPYPPHVRYYQVFDYMFVFSKDKPKSINLLRTDTIEKWRMKDKHSSTTREKDGTTKHLKYETGKATRVRDNVWLYNCGYMRGTADKIAFKHPATFPDKLAEDHILSWSNENDLVLDPMCGSGTTCKMAKKNNRNYIGIDISEEYIRIAEERINGIKQNLSGKLPDSIEVLS